MLYTLAIVLFILWLAGLVTPHTLGPYVHLLLLGALVVGLARIIQGRRVL